MTFRIWAPKQQEMHVVVGEGQPLRMRSRPDGWHLLDVAGAAPGTLYHFVLPDGMRVPDPASRYQPRDVHGPSEVIDPYSYQWIATDWAGRPWTESVIYEAHIGAFTRPGTFRAAIERLDHLKDLGITVLQLMPVADFPGRRGWGYDGVLPYSPEASYGRPDDLKMLVDQAHGRGISVMLDVVYNHLGPDGNYLPHYAPFFTDRHKTPWGDGPNFDGETSPDVRSFVVENALYWLEEFRFDGLRLDAVHAILDDSGRHILQELAETVHAEITDRHVHLVVENEDNDADLLERTERGSPKYYAAQWCDDIHHVLHSAATGESDGYYADYAGDVAKVGKALAEGYVFQGELMRHSGKRRGKPSAHLPPTAFISFIQNHDQVGNRLYGDRLNETLPFEKLCALASIYLLAPEIPMILMGEEWSATTRLPYFCDFNDELNAEVREGRKKEFGHDPNQAGSVEEAPDPTSEQTFLSAKLIWEEGRRGEHRQMLQYYRNLLDIRRRSVVPILGRIGSRPAEYSVKDDVVEVRWHAGETSLVLLANLGETPARVNAPARTTRFFPEEPSDLSTMGPWNAWWFVGREGL